MDLLYPILVGLTVLLYIRQWGLLLQVRSYAVYVTVPMLWSCVFIHLLLETYLFVVDTEQAFTSPSFLVFMLSVAIYYWIGMLLFPQVEQLDKQDQFAYFDYYEHFRKQHQWLIGLALIAFSLKLMFFTNCLMQDANYLILVGLIWAFFVEHKGLMCLLAWIILSTLVFF